MVRYDGAPNYGPAPHQGEHHEQQPRRLLGRGLLACLLGCTQPVLAQSDAGNTALSCPDQRDGVALAGWVIVEGDPRGDVILAPSDSREERRVAVNVWDLTEYRGSRLSLRCAYGPNRGRDLVVSLPSSLKQCVARGAMDRAGRVAIPMAVRCQ